MNTGNDTDEHISALIHLLKNSGAMLSSKIVTAGFDGFIDTIVKAIRDKQPEQPPALFNTIKEFGAYITAKDGSSFSLELEERNIKAGGNMPIMANALGHLGVVVNCIGALGHPQIHPAFKTLSPNCNIYSFADPGTSTAIEFQDGKMILGLMDSLHRADWDTIKNTIGLEVLVNLFKASDLLCLVNWAEIDASTDIWKGIMKDVFPHYTKDDKTPIIFVDLSDFSKRDNKAVMEVLQLLKELTNYGKLIIGLNKNEAKLIYTALFQKPPGDELESLGSPIFDELKPTTLVLHSPKQAIAIDNSGLFACNSFFVADPKISTGAGDNFNAGFCAAQLLNASAALSIVFANAVSALYVRNGISPQLNDVAGFLENQLIVNKG
ncbi:MAG: PfkB family carbohydrate kinase [Ferruginibacter sp.]